MSIEYHWKKFPWYNKPIKSDREWKKKMVLAKQGDKVKLVHFWAEWYSDFTKHKNEKRRANFKARHNCAAEKNKLTARRWACNNLR